MSVGFEILRAVIVKHTSCWDTTTLVWSKFPAISNDYAASFFREEIIIVPRTLGQQLGPAHAGMFLLKVSIFITDNRLTHPTRQWHTEEGFGGFKRPYPQPPKFRRPSKIVPNSIRLWKLLKIAEFKKPTPQDVRKKGSKILKLLRFAIVLH